MMSIEELKKLAEWMEYEFIDRLHVKNKHGHYVADGRPWLEKGGKDLAEVLKKLDKSKLIWKLAKHSGMRWNPLYFQNPKNAPTIIKAVLKVIECK